MAWVRIDDQAPWHPKMLRAGESACWLWACGLAYCSAHLTDGEIPEAAITTMGVKRPAEAAAKLVAVGLWELTDDGFLIHDYLEYNPSSSQVRAKRKAGADRVQNWKLTRGHVGQKRDGNAVANATETPLLTLQERDGNAVTNAAPVPVPVPVPVLRTNTQERTSADADESPAALTRWLTDLCPSLPEIRSWTETRKRTVKARWREHPDAAWWTDLLTRIEASDFLTGRCPPRDGHGSFKADVFWCLKPDNLAKILEGRYDNRPTAPMLGAGRTAGNAAALNAYLETFHVD